MVRACTASALDSRVGPAFWSTTTTGTPRRVSTSPAIRPVGPAPTTRTSVSAIGRSAIRTVVIARSFGWPVRDDAHPPYLATVTALAAAEVGETLRMS